MYPCVSEHIGSKTLPSAGIQLNTIYLRKDMTVLEEDLYGDYYSWWRENKREESGSAWFQPLLADEARVSWWRETQEGVVGGCSPSGPPWWDAPESKQHMVPPRASAHILHVQQHSRLRDALTQHTVINTQTHSFLSFIEAFYSASLLEFFCGYKCCSVLLIYVFLFYQIRVLKKKCFRFIFQVSWLLGLNIFWNYIKGFTQPKTCLFNPVKCQNCNW